MIWWPCWHQRIIRKFDMLYVFEMRLCVGESERIEIWRRHVKEVMIEENVCYGIIVNDVVLEPMERG